MLISPQPEHRIPTRKHSLRTKRDKPFEIRLCIHRHDLFPHRGTVLSSDFENELCMGLTATASYAPVLARASASCGCRCYHHLQHLSSHGFTLQTPRDSDCGSQKILWGQLYMDITRGALVKGGLWEKI